jgi:hypothetical protein
MPPRFQADEDLNAKIIAGLLRREPSIDFQTAETANILGLPDHEVLSTASREGRILVSHDRKTMPAHFSRFVADSDSAGLLVVSQSVAVRDVIEQVLIIWTASEVAEWRNRIGYLPF